MNDPFFIFSCGCAVVFVGCWIFQQTGYYKAAQRRAAEHFDGREQVPADSFPAAKNGERARKSPPVGSLTHLLQ